MLLRYLRDESLNAMSSERAEHFLSPGKREAHSDYGHEEHEQAHARRDEATPTPMLLPHFDLLHQLFGLLRVQRELQSA